MTRINEIYGLLVRKYGENHRGISGLANRINKLTNEGKTWEEAVVIFALELGLKIPEIENLIGKGMSQDEAISKFSQNLAIEEQIQDVYSKSKPSKPSITPQASPSNVWYLLPVFFGLLGGIIGYVGVKNEKEEMANNILNLGIIMTVIEAILYYMLFLFV
jgi:hypothetical protein